MARTRRRRGDPSRQRADAGSEPSGTGGFIGQIGLFETANGLPHGPSVIILGIVAVLVLYPITRIVRFVMRR